MKASALVAALLAATPGLIEAEEVRVGSKGFTESVILGEIVTRSLEGAGIEARHRRQLGGTRILWEALRGGDVDVYPEYTGTIRGEILGDEEVATDAALEAALAERGVLLGPRLGFENTYAIAVRRETAERLELETIADLARHPELSFGFSNEFMDRGDGWPAVRDRYRLPHRFVRGLDHDLAYRALASGSIDVVDAYSTDAEIARYDLVTLADPLEVFPEYEAVLLLRTDLSERAPEALEVVRSLEGRLDTATMTALNAAVAVDGRKEGEAAAEFLGTTGSGPGVAIATRWQRIGRRTVEHLLLVAVALGAGFAVAFPLGVLAAARPVLGQALLGVVGTIQTVPSLALLALMVPVLGIGAVPAIVALFLYSLLPIVRNTVSGLHSIPLPIRESALALGLDGRTRLVRIELPLAARTILAGVKTSAVITVGYATLGALIGAGGYGQPILTGIRLADPALILEGAIPAALMALAAQALFDLVERLATPRGLRG